MSHPDVEVDTANQRLCLTMEGRPSIEESAAVPDACVEGAKRLEDGFDCIDDMRDFQPTDEAALEDIERGKRGLAKNGTAAAVRSPPTRPPAGCSGTAPVRTRRGIEW